MKAFHCEIQNNHKGLQSEQNNYKPLPTIRIVDAALVRGSYLRIRQDVEDLVNAELERMMGDPELARLIVKK